MRRRRRHPAKKARPRKAPCAVPSSTVPARAQSNVCAVDGASTGWVSSERKTKDAYARRSGVYASGERLRVDISTSLSLLRSKDFVGTALGLAQPWAGVAFHKPPVTKRQ